MPSAFKSMSPYPSMYGENKEILLIQWQVQHPHLCDGHQCECHQLPSQLRQKDHVMQVAACQIEVMRT